MTLSRRDLRHAYDASASGYDAKFAELQAVKYDIVFTRYMPPPNARVVDLGCGTGMLMARLTHLQTPPVALDLSSEMLAVGSLAQPVQGDLFNLPFFDRSFDVAFAITSLLVTPAEAVGVFTEIRRVLVQGGVLVLTVLQREVWPGFEDDLRASGLAPDDCFPCGQDQGWICRRG